MSNGQEPPRRGAACVIMSPGLCPEPAPSRWRSATCRRYVRPRRAFDGQPYFELAPTARLRHPSYPTFSGGGCLFVTVHDARMRETTNSQTSSTHLHRDALYLHSHSGRRPLHMAVGSVVYGVVPGRSRSPHFSIPPFGPFPSSPEHQPLVCPRAAGSLRGHGASRQ